MVYGHYYRTLSKLPAADEICPNCGAKGQMQIEVICKVSHMMFIPSWASKKDTLVTCNICNKKFYTHNFPNLKKTADKLMAQSSYRWWYFIGTIVYIGIVPLPLGLIFFGSTNKEDRLMDDFNKMHAGQVIFYKIDKMKKSCMYIDSITSDSIIVRENKLSTNKHVENIDEPYNYSDQQSAYSKDQIRKMIEAGDLIDIQTTTTYIHFNKDKTNEYF